MRLLKAKTTWVKTSWPLRSLQQVLQATSCAGIHVENYAMFVAGRAKRQRTLVQKSSFNDANYLLFLTNSNGQPKIQWPSIWACATHSGCGCLLQGIREEVKNWAPNKLVAGVHHCIIAALSQAINANPAFDQTSEWSPMMHRSLPPLAWDSSQSPANTTLLRRKSFSYGGESKMLTTCRNQKTDFHKKWIRSSQLRSPWRTLHYIPEHLGKSLPCHVSISSVMDS